VRSLATAITSGPDHRLDHVGARLVDVDVGLDLVVPDRPLDASEEILPTPRVVGVLRVPLLEELGDPLAPGVDRLLLVDRAGVRVGVRLGELPVAPPDLDLVPEDRARRPVVLSQSAHSSGKPSSPRSSRGAWYIG
jgi:hypothetical protein